MTESNEPVRWTVLFSGRVQGVGFRFTTERLARGFAVTGYVRNLPDGRVELVVEGSPREVRGLVDAVEKAMAGYIRDRQMTNSSAGGTFSDFSTRF